jgi:hypothetical protein
VHPSWFLEKKGGIKTTLLIFIFLSAPGLLPEGVIYYLVVYLFVYKSR